jgi:[protein-PII] uridylyltransferase
MITGRHEDRLLFDHQIKLAGLFGYVDDRQLAVEQFMQLYYRTIKSLSGLNDMLLQLFDEAILGRGKAAEVKLINPRFQVRDGYIEVRDDEVFRQDPVALIEIFAIMQRRPGISGIRAETLRLIRRDRRLVDARLAADVRARAFFIGMFRDEHGVHGLTTTLRLMSRYDVLGRYLPMFGRVVGHMQFDLFHTLTVDEHSIFVVRNLRRMALDKFRHELPHFSEIMTRIPRRDLLYLAGFLHDLAKGSGRDHSEAGAEEAEKLCLNHGLSHADADLVCWLVRHHLLMSLTAQRKDISSPEVILDFAHAVGERTRLDYLLLLTVADIRATNPALWNVWKESLLKELYDGVSRAFERGLDNPVTEAERVAEQQRHALALLGSAGDDAIAREAERVWKHFDSDYFLRHSPAELAWHVPSIEAATEDDLPLILVNTLDDRGTTVFVYMRDRDHLFALCTGVLAKLGLSILDARINTTADSYVLDSFVVIESDGSPLYGEHRHDDIINALRKVLSDPTVSGVEVTRRPAQKLKHFDTPTTVFFSQDSNRGRTVIELVTSDQPGLLSTIGRIFQKRGILLDAAKIATIGARAEDVFFVTDRQHQPITDEKSLEDLRETLVRTLNKKPA